jgi:predicted extracellular nuclease
MGDEAIVKTISFSVVAPTYASDLFISEVYEGASNNKYVEIFNGTGAAVDLQNYAIRTGVNGALFTSTQLRLSPSTTPLMLEHNNTVVVYNNSIDNNLFPLLTSIDGSYTTGIKINGGAVNAVTFNGDDAVGLFKTTDGTNFNLIDIMGISGEGDPGSTFVGLKTDDTSVQRKSSVRSPFVTTIGSPTPTSYRWDIDQWTSTAINTTTNSGGGTPGSHNMNFKT